MSGVRMLHFLIDWWKFIQIHQYYTMALKSHIKANDEHAYYLFDKIVSELFDKINLI